MNTAASQAPKSLRSASVYDAHMAARPVTLKPTHSAASRPKAFYSTPFVELHMLEPGQSPTAKTRAFRLPRSAETETLVQLMCAVHLPTPKPQEAPAG